MSEIRNTTHGQRTEDDTSRFQDALQRLRLRALDTISVVPGDRFPHYTSLGTETWTTTAEGSWTGGFWAGWLWKLYGHFGDEVFAERALAATLKLKDRLWDDTHDRGFLFYYSAVTGWHVARQPELRELGLQAAHELCNAFNPRAGVIPVGRQAEVQSGTAEVTIDAMMNLQLLWWAHSETGEQDFLNVALSHAERTAQWHVRDDGSTFQSAHFDERTGELLELHTHQGYGPQSCWARGQAWCINGFASAYEATGSELFRDIATKALNFYVSHLPGDRVPYYDFLDPKIPDVERDTSASAIIASATLEGSARYLFDRYREQILCSLRSLVTAHLGSRGGLAHGCYNRHTGEGIDGEVIWGNYYLCSALLGFVTQSET